MPQRDKYHEAVRKALETAGWVITHDPLWLKLDHTGVFIDIAAERVPSLTEPSSSVAIEVKVFSPTNILDEIEKALGQYILYRGLLELKRPSYRCYLAIPEQAYTTYLEGPDFQYILRRNAIQIVTFDPQREEVVRWIN